MTTDWVTTSKAAEQTGLTPDYIRRLIRSHKVEGRKWGNSWMVSRESIEQYAQNARGLGMKRGRKRKPLE
jgi:excisionase family DNA binding protein